LVGPQVGSNSNEEFEGPLAGVRMTGYTLAFTLLETRPANMQILWTGLANSARQREMEARQSPYTAEWKGMVVADSDVEAMSPQIGILFGSADLTVLRRKLRDPAWSRAFAALKESLAGAMTWEPEREIGKYIAKPDRRWVRDRDMGKHCTAGVMESLAFVGLVEQDARYLRMAARMALSAAHCETWSESIVGSLPGTTWHHRSFTEEIYCRACGLVLDWAGCMLTPHARQLIADAIIMKGLPRIESDFKRMEYIRHMNQGIIFSSGRILGALAVLPLYPRYGSLVDDAERDLDEMISNYVHDDGGTLEGMAYWSYTFSSVMPIVWALARHREQALAEYATETLKKTGAYGLGMLSTIGEGASYLAINDAHIDGHYPAGLCAAYASLSGDPRWQALYRASLQAEDRRADIYQLIMAVDEETELEIAGTTLLEPRFSVFPDVGQVSSVRTLPAGTHEPGVPLSQADEGETEGVPRDVVHFHLCSGPTYGGHYHQDKGAFILEAGGEPLAYDRGVTSYDHPEVNLIGLASRHNLLYPEAPDGRFIIQPRDVCGATLTDAREEDGVFMAVSDNLKAWEPGVFTYNVRRVFSPSPELYVIDDEVTLDAVMSVSFRVSTPLVSKVTSAGVTITGQRYALHIVPLNWRPAAVTTTAEGLDSHLEPANLVRLVAPAGPAFRLLTALIVTDAGAAPPETPPGAAAAPEVRFGGLQVRAVMADNALTLTVREEGVMGTYRCLGDRWVV
ncbi:MAG: hypothetical protein J7M39_04185, partial [Anaerolineae bacterium]|nr:hypothetical protein [Anaerolineae bacterium]